jgi:uncharacterized heparinase superfamily protein
VAHAEVGLAVELVPGTALIETPGGGHWRFSAEGAALVLEQSFDYAHYSGPRLSQQIVLRGTTAGETVVQWRLERAAAGNDMSLN